MNNEKKQCTFLWLVENYSYCSHQTEVGLNSPKFTAEGYGGTVWYLRLYPRGSNDKNKGHISLFLRRNEEDNGPEDFFLAYELSILAADGSALISDKFEYTFKKEMGYGFVELLQIDEVLLRRNSEFLPQDTLRVRCRIWTGEGNIQLAKEITARTRIGIEHVSFLQVVEDFSELEPNVRRTVQIRSALKKGVDLLCRLYYSDDNWCAGKIMMDIEPSVSNQILSKCQLFLNDASGALIECGDADSRFGATRTDITKLELSLNREVILTRKSEYLPDDKFSLLCHCVFTVGIEYEKIEKTLYEMPLNLINDIAHGKKKYDMPEMHLASPGALEDLKTMYNCRRLTDIELKTESKSFPAHKLVLCARSSVFDSMLTSDMREKNTNSIQIDDLEDGTVQLLLLFLYSDRLANLEWGSATKLYYASDKYNVGKLKMMCTSFLLENINVSNSSELLRLADTHSDSHLKKAVEEFIFKHDNQVFCSEEWENFMESNPLLASKTMRLSYMRKL